MLRANFQTSASYPLMLSIWMLEIFVIPTVVLFVWLTIINSNSNLEESRQQIINYYILLPVVAMFVSAWSGGFLAERIRTGKLSLALTRPFHIFNFYISVNIVEKIVKTLFLFPFILIAAVGFGFSLSVTPIALIAGIFAIILGAAMHIIIDLIIGTLSFWLEEVQALINLFDAIYFALGGRVIPFFFLPLAVQATTKWLPFRYLASFPLEILTHNLSTSDIIVGLAIQIVWIAITYILLKKLWSAGIKKYQAYGD